jgi:hypothetical protein
VAGGVQVFQSLNQDPTFLTKAGWARAQCWLLKLQQQRAQGGSSAGSSGLPQTESEMLAAIGSREDRLMVNLLGAHQEVA